VTGASIWKLRRLIERKEDRIAPYFLRDLLAHTFGNTASGRHETGARNAAR
jgi:hypothetical protein